MYLELDLYFNDNPLFAYFNVESNIAISYE